MAATSAKISPGNTVQSIFEKLTYGPVPDADIVAKTWLDDHNRQFGHFVDGQWYKAENGKQWQTHNPATGEVLASLQETSESDINKAVASSKSAFEKWNSLAPHVRARHLYSIARHIQKHQQLFAVVETLDTGRAVREARDTDVPQVVRIFYHYAGLAQLRDTELQGFKPYGIVAVLPSWSYPLITLSLRVCTALAVGNTVIVSPSPATPLSALLFADICREAGLPKGVVNVLTDSQSREGVHKLVMHDEVKKVAFAGKTEEGKKLRRLLAGSGKSLSLELSGKSSMIVFDTADLDSAVEGVVDATWTNQGQSNSAGSRLFVQESVADDMTVKLRKRLEKLRVGDSLDKSCDLGAMTCDWLPKIIEQSVNIARSEGAEVYQANMASFARGWFYPPTLITGAQAASRIVIEDFLGPVVVLIPFRTAKEAIALANNSSYAVAGSIWTESVSLALEVAAGIQAGTVWINCHNLFDAAAGVGGGKQSGWGRTGGRRGLLEYVQPSWALYSKPGNLDISFETFGSAVPPRPSLPAVDMETDQPSIDHTYKLYYGGAQKRPDGQYSRPVVNPENKVIGHVAEASRKDVRNAVEAAQKAFAGWSKRSGHNCAQILYYIAENLELRKEGLATCLELMMGLNKGQGQREVDLSLERLFYWAAYCDKFGGTVQEVPIYGSVMEINEPVGVIGVACPDTYPLLAFVSLFAAAIARSNTVILIPSKKYPLAAVDLYQIFDTSDVPEGVVNILTGDSDHLTRFLVEHQDVQAVWYFGSPEGSKFVEHMSADSLKRTWVSYGQERNFADCAQGVGEEWLFHTTQPKTVWIPMGDIFAN